jgi:elongation factor Ts
VRAGVPTAQGFEDMTITAEMVKQLREMTGAGMMECKKALTDTKGDLQKAVDELRKAGIAKAEKRADRAASQGRVDSYIHDSRIGVLIEVNCETDFVARTDDFIALCRDLGMQAAAANADYVRREEVPAERLERERAIYAEQLKNEGKPAQMIDKILEGKLNKFYSEVCLMEQPFIKDDKKSVGDLVKEASSRTGENIVVRRFVRFRLGAE